MADETSRQRAVLITGASGGIGLATAQLFARRGWRVVAVDRAEPREKLNNEALHIQADVSQPEDLSSIFDRMRGFTDRLDALVNNAAIQIAKPLLETSVEEWDAVMASNLRSVFLGVKLAHPLLATRGGAVVNVSSVHAVATSKDISAYAASKGGLLALTRAMAIEFADDGIRVNAVLPGAVDTPMHRAGLSRGHLQEGTVSQRLDNLANKTVIGRVGRPDEIAQAIYFLADGEQSSFMTGQALVVDGGATARLSTE